VKIQRIDPTWHESFWYARRILWHVLLGGRLVLWVTEQHRVYFSMRGEGK